jgi:hypothetical protein
MRRFAISLVAAAALITSVMLPATAALATNSSECTFSKGTTTCTTVKGSKGSTDSNKGQSGTTKSPPAPESTKCKVTGPTHSC